MKIENETHKKSQSIQCEYVSETMKWIHNKISNETNMKIQMCFCNQLIKLSILFFVALIASWPRLSPHIHQLTCVSDLTIDQLSRWFENIGY